MTEQEHYYRDRKRYRRNRPSDLSPVLPRINTQKVNELLDDLGINIRTATNDLRLPAVTLYNILNYGHRWRAKPAYRILNLLHATIDDITDCEATKQIFRHYVSKQASMDDIADETYYRKLSEDEAYNSELDSEAVQMILNDLSDTGENNNVSSIFKDAKSTHIHKRKNLLLGAHKIPLVQHIDHEKIDRLFRRNLRRNTSILARLLGFSDVTSIRHIYSWICGSSDSIPIHHLCRILYIFQVDIFDVLSDDAELAEKGLNSYVAAEAVMLRFRFRKYPKGYFTIDEMQSWVHVMASDDSPDHLSDNGTSPDIQSYLPCKEDEHMYMFRFSDKAVLQGEMKDAYSLWPGIQIYTYPYSKAHEMFEKDGTFRAHVVLIEYDDSIECREFAKQILTSSFAREGHGTLSKPGILIYAITDYLDPAEISRDRKFICFRQITLDDISTHELRTASDIRLPINTNQLEVQDDVVEDSVQVNSEL